MSLQECRQRAKKLSYSGSSVCDFYFGRQFLVKSSHASTQSSSSLPKIFLRFLHFLVIGLAFVLWRFCTTTLLSYQFSVEWMRYTDQPPSQITETVFVEINEYMYYVVSAPVGVLPGTLCTSIEEPLPSKWASRALKYLHSGFKPWTRLPQVLIMEEIETFPRLWLSAVRVWSQEHGLDSGQQCKVMSHVRLLRSLFCIYFIYMIIHSCSNTSPFVIFPQGYPQLKSPS